MKNVYQIGSGELTFDIIEQIISENLKLELVHSSKSDFASAIARRRFSSVWQGRRSQGRLLSAKEISTQPFRRRSDAPVA